MKPFFKPVCASLAALVLFTGIWSIAARWFPPYLLPGPITLIKALPQLWGPSLKQDLFMTAFRASLGFAVAFFLGTALGIVCKAFRAAMVMEILLALVQVIPGLILGILFLVIFGVGDTAPVCLVIALSAPLTAVHTANVLARPRPVMEDVVRVFGGSFSHRILDIYLPALVPALKSNATLGVVMAVKITLLGEFLASDSGLGHRLNAALISFDMTEVYFSLAVVFAALILCQIGIHLICILLLGRFFNPE